VAGKGREKYMTDQEMMETIEAQEDALQFERFSNGDALAIGLALVDKAKTRGHAVAIDISRAGQQLFHYAFAGTSADNDQWIIRKNRSVARFGRSSLYMGAKLRREGTTLENKYCISSTEYSSSGGAFPISLRGSGVVGSVTVSGLKQEDDHALVVETLREFLSQGSS
jgi:uncharacterized protein (UPF0303 family)